MDFDFMVLMMVVLVLNYGVWFDCRNRDRNECKRGTELFIFPLYLFRFSLLFSDSDSMCPVHCRILFEGLLGVLSRLVILTYGFVWVIVRVIYNHYWNYFELIPDLDFNGNENVNENEHLHFD